MSWTKNENYERTLYHLYQALGLEESGEDVLGILGVSELEDFRGSFAEAVQVLNGRADAVRMQKQLQDISGSLPEAPVTANASFQTPAGGVWQVTLRPIVTSDVMVAGMKNLVTGIELFEQAVIKGRKWTPVQRYSQIPANGGGSGLGPSTGHAGEQGNLYTRRGVGELLALTVKSGKFMYDVDGLQFEIGDSRGWETATSYWTESCFADSFTAKTLERNGVWGEEDFGQKLMVRYGKNRDTGYWDALAVFPEGEA